MFQKKSVSGKAELVTDREPDHGQIDHIGRRSGDLINGSDPSFQHLDLPQKFSPTFWSHLGPQADMPLIQISTQLCGRWLAALLLLPAQQAFSLSDQMLKDVDYPVLPLFGPMLTVCNYHGGSPLCIIPPTDGNLLIANAVCRPFTSAPIAK